ncbi:MAG: hypothetical protein ABF743_12270 [Schleiferilactobacillus perolens]|uniref:hypothetical protein n=1 Tax=Schleiferilactobacillus perolens TaxID=100468 RepID=UPI0039EA3FDB
MDAHKDLQTITGTVDQLTQQCQTAARRMDTQTSQWQRLADQFEQDLQKVADGIKLQLARLDKLAEENQDALTANAKDAAADQQAIDDPPDFDGQVADLQNQIEAMNRDTIPAYQQELQPLLTTQQEQRHTLTGLQSQLQDIVAQENHIAIKIRKAKSLHDMIAVTNEEQGNIDALRGQREDLTSQIKDVQQTLTDGQRDIDQVNHKIEDAKKQMTTWDTQSRQLQEAKRRRPSQVARFQQHIQELAAQAAGLQKMSDQISAARDKTQDAANTVSEQLTDLQPLLTALNDIVGTQTVAEAQNSAADSSAPTPAPPAAGPVALILPLLPKNAAHVATLQGVMQKLVTDGTQSVHLYTTGYEEEDMSALQQLLGEDRPAQLAWTNMYTALRQTQQPAAQARLNVQPDWVTRATPDNQTVEYLTPANKLAARVQYRQNGKIRSVTYFNLPGGAQRRDFWDPDGRVAVTQSVNAQTGRVTNENFYRVDGSVVLIKEYQNNQEQIHVLAEDRHVLQEFTSDDALAAWWLSQAVPQGSTLVAPANPRLLLSKSLQERTDLQVVPILTPESTPQIWAELLGGEIPLETAYVSNPNLQQAAEETLPSVHVETLTD